MTRLALLALAASAMLPACLLEGPTPYEVSVEWSTPGTHADHVMARITYDGAESVTHGSLESHGYTGSTLVTGETNDPSIEICVELGNYEWITEESGYGCESGDYECDTTTTREFVASKVRCATVTPDETHVAINF